MGKSDKEDAEKSQLEHLVASVDRSAEGPVARISQDQNDQIDQQINTFLSSFEEQTIEQERI